MKDLNGRVLTVVFHGVEDNVATLEMISNVYIFFT